MYSRVAQRMDAEENIMRSEAFVRNILNSIEEGCLIVDRDYRIIVANEAYCSLIGNAGNEVIGRRCYELSHAASGPCGDAGEDCAVKNAFRSKRPCMSNHRHMTGGELVYCRTKAVPLRDGSGNVIAVLETITNITEQHLLEEEQLKMQKLESIGTFAAGIAHDFNNLLQGIFGHISMARMTYSQKERSLALLDQAEAALNQAANLTTQLLTFAKGGRPIERKRVSLRQTLEHSVKFALSGSRAEYRVYIAPDLWDVEANIGQMGQAFQNIILNADQAMPSGGRVDVTARNLTAENAAIVPNLEKTDHVEISFTDSGCGIPAENIVKIFDPYFTTKKRGTGLGLSTTLTIVRNHGGQIFVRSTGGLGSTFILYLPALRGAVEAASPARAVPVTRRGKILVMDDDMFVRSTSQEMLSLLGHEAHTAEGGGQAIEKVLAAKTAGSPFDVVILDLTVRGGMGGTEAVVKICDIDPQIKAVLSSGYTEGNVISEYRRYGFRAVLCKPYQIKTLKDTLDVLMA